jgi:hypothetical protein
MSCCEKELKQLIQIYQARIGGTESFLIDLNFKGRSNSISYKINDKMLFLLKQIGLQKHLLVILNGNGWQPI